VEIARRLLTENQVDVAELWSYHTIGDQTRFTLVQRATTAGPTRAPAAAALPRKAAPAAPPPPARSRKPAPPPRKAAPATRPAKGRAASRSKTVKSARTQKRK